MIYHSISNFKGVHKQSGAVLMVSLVLLLVMTILGVSNMQSTSTELKMATNNQSRQVVFQAAEAALRIVEQEIVNDGYNENLIVNCTSGDSGCFEDTCKDGLCFMGQYVFGDTRLDCQTVVPSPGGDIPDPVWSNSDLDVWNDTDKHNTKAIAGDNVPDPKVIVEFMCFIENPEVSFLADPNSGLPLFRITALAQSEDGKTQVMLQSTTTVD